MRKTGQAFTTAAALAALTLAGPAGAQTGTYGYGGMNSAGSSVYSLVPDIPSETAEEKAANADESVIIHFNSSIFGTSTLQLVIMVQEYYRRGYRKFVLSIQTGGGSINSAMYAYETLSRMPVEFTTVAMGHVDSAGIYLYCLGDKRYASPGSTFLFHPMNGTINSNRREQEANERQIDSIKDWGEGVTRDCFGETPEDWDLERRDYRATLEDAVEVGIVNAGSDYFEAVETVGEVSYVYPVVFYSGQQ